MRNENVRNHLEFPNTFTPMKLDDKREKDQISELILCESYSREAIEDLFDFGFAAFRTELRCCE